MAEPSDSTRGLREMVVWSHPKGEEDTQMLAEDLVLMGVARLTRAKPAAPTSEPVETGVLVVGGGVAGMVAAKTLADQGFPVHLYAADLLPGGMLPIGFPPSPADRYDLVAQLNQAGNRIPALELDNFQVLQP